jgi:apolipoprotein N-acyltransferase
MRIRDMDEPWQGPFPRMAVIQGNIDQARKWDPAFQIGTTKKYVDLTLSAVPVNRIWWCGRKRRPRFTLGPVPSSPGW